MKFVDIDSFQGLSERQLWWGVIIPMVNLKNGLLLSVKMRRERKGY